MSFDSSGGAAAATAPRRHALLERPGLVSRLEESERPLALIAAPAGYGKTTLLTEWAGRDGRSFASVSLRAHHDDPITLVGAICEAISALEPLGDDVLAPLAAPTPRVHDVVVPRLLAALADRESMVLAVDDLHQVTDPAALDALEAIGRGLPPGSTLALAARTEPRMRIARSRASGELFELGAEDLTMSAVEAARLLEGCGLTLSDADVSLLLERTEGWPAGLYLAGLTLLAADDVGEGVERFAGDERVVADYLRDEFISTLPGEDADFLVRTSILEHLSGDVCDAVAGGEGSGERLNRLARSNLLMAPVDRAGESLRVHALMRSMLRAELRRRGERAERELHRRAAGWYREHGEPEDAIRHSIAAGETDAAGELIWEQAGTYESHGGHATLAQWLSEFSEQQIRDCPHLCLTMAAGGTSMGDGAAVEHWCSLAAAGKGRLPADARTEVAAGIQLLRAGAAAREGLERMGADAAEALTNLPVGSPFCSFARYLEGVARHLSGEPDAARELLEDGARRGAVNGPMLEIVCLAQLALLSLDRGEPDRAGRDARRAVELIDHYALYEYPVSAIAFAVAGLASADGGDAASAATNLARCSEGLERLAELDSLSPWFETQVRVVLARALRLLDDADGARTQLGIAGRRMKMTPDAVTLRSWIEAAWADLEAAAAAGGRWPLTAAELRLVHFLPTHLSFKQIAEELYVSPNTVKTQATSIYRKFGVRSRAEAVACARSAGLLGTRDRSDA